MRHRFIGFESLLNEAFVEHLQRTLVEKKQPFHLHLVSPGVEFRG